jgi:AP-1-like transcription factor
MAATRNPLRDFILTPQQQSLLFAALNSNKQATEAAPAGNNLNMSPTSFTESPVQTLNSVQESPFLDYDYDFGNGESSFDFSFDNGNPLKMIGDLPGGANSSKSASPEGDSPDKRSHPEDEAEEKEESSNKRRESEEKVAKKPGRKPLTSEPSSVSLSKAALALSATTQANDRLQKRKAQNRAAQRAFRERKEQHLKDLEEKVEELQKSTDQANSENSALKAQVEKMTIELAEYKKRLTIVSTKPSPTTARPGFGAPAVNNLNDVNFQFEFPKFGALPGSTTQPFNAPKRLSSAPSFATSLTRTPSGQISPTGENPQPAISPSNSSSYSQIGLDAQTRDDLAKFSTSIFGVSAANKELSNNSRTSFDSLPSLIGGTNTSSPSASSTSNVGPSSSAGTSPEPFTQSPMGFKPVETMTTIGEEQPSVTSTGQGKIHRQQAPPTQPSGSKIQTDASTRILRSTTRHGYIPWSG